MSYLSPIPIIYQNESFAIYSHGLLFMLGLILGILILRVLATRAKLDKSLAIEMAGWPFLIGLVFARIGYVITYHNEFDSLKSMLSLWNGGLISYYGIAGGLVAMFFIARALDKQNWRKWLDIILIASTFAWATGRIGNFLAGDSIGIANDHFAFFYGLVPIQLFESLWTVIVGIWTWKVWSVVENKKEFTDDTKKMTKLYHQARVTFNQKIIQERIPLWIIGSYALGRMIIDLWRDEEKISGLWGPSSITCAVIVLVVFLIDLIRYGGFKLMGQQIKNIQKKWSAKSSD